jgi:hypothetical protein
MQWIVSLRCCAAAPVSLVPVVHGFVVRHPRRRICGGLSPDAHIHGNPPFREADATIREPKGDAKPVPGQRPQPARGKQDAGMRAGRRGINYLPPSHIKGGRLGWKHPTLDSCRSLLSAAFGCWRDAAADGTMGLWRAPPAVLGNPRYANTSEPRAGDAPRGALRRHCLPSPCGAGKSWARRFAPKPKGDNRTRSG